ncbi:MAG: diguanylate phosphodiesterase [Piscirickettsiaceae bacterium]|nr:MAG: diguanylate phosphodiesterase [Piscirickettsiaceae bacterium]
MIPNESTATINLASLPDATEFEEQTEHLLAFTSRTDAKAALLYIAFDKLVSHINDKQNNLALNAISERLLSKARESDIYAHIGGMNFANLSIETSLDHIKFLVEKLKNELARPIELADGSLIKLNAKIGVAQFPNDGQNYHELMSHAQKAAL